MADIDLKTETPDTTLPTTGFLFGADSQAAASPSVYSTQTVATTLLGSTSLTGATVTTSSPVIDAAQTWNASGVTFTGLRFNATDTASASGSLLMDLQVGGASRFSVSKSGTLYGVNPTTWTSFEVFFDAAAAIARTVSKRVLLAGQDASGVRVSSNYGYSWSSNSANSGDAFANSDLFLTRRGAANLRLGAADAAGSAISISSVASNQLTLASNHGLSNGAAVQITFTAGGAVPSGTAVNTTYYARSISAAVLELYGTYDQALNTASTTGRVAVTTAGTTAFINRAAPFQTLSVQSFTGTDIPGQPFVITGSQGTGTGAGGSIIFQVAPAGSSGTAQNALADALTIGGDRRLSFPDGTFIINNAPTGASNQIGIWAGGVFGLNRGGGNASQIVLYANGVSGLVLNGGTSGGAAPFLSFASPTAGTHDTFITRDAANTLALRNGANAQESRVYGSYTSATNFQRMSIKTLRESSGALSGASYTTTIAIPAYANLIGVTTRVTTEVTGATTYDVGDGTDVDLWGAAIGVALGSQSRTADFTAVGAVGAAATSRTVTLTANGSNFTGGVVEICLHYLTTEAD